MFIKLFINEWKQKLRSPYLSTSLVQKILIGLFALYFLLNFLVLGIYMDEVLEKVFPNSNSIVKFNGLLLYYFIFDLLTRFFMQQFPVLTIQPYLTLPIKKSNLIHFLLLKSVPTFFNLLGLLLFLPFFFKVILANYTLAASISWLLTLVSMVLLSNFLSFYLKKAFDIKPLLIFLIICLVGGLFYLDNLGYIGLSGMSEAGMNFLCSQVYWALIPVGLLVGVYFFTYRFFKAHIYLDSFSRQEAQKLVSTSELNLFSRFGKIGELMNLEMKMIWRNGRSRTFLYLSIFFLFFPFLMIGGGHGLSYKIMFGILLTGMFAFNHAQLLLSWHSSHFDYILTRNLTAQDLFKSKFYLLALSVFISYLLMLPFSFFLEHWFLISSMSMFFNVGVGIFLYMYLANYNSMKIDASKGNVFNFEGFGASHYLIMLPLIVIPILIALPFEWLGYPGIGMAAFGLLGILGFVFQERILAWIRTHFEKRKHIISTAFRNQ